MQTTRLPYVDALKGFAIFLVVLGHVLQHYYSHDALAFRIVYSFHMPLFMFISGYVCYRKSEWSLVKKRAVQLLVPFFSCIVLNYCIDLALGDATVSLVTYLWNVLLQPDRGLWFLWALFFISALFICCQKIARRFSAPDWSLFLITAVVLNGIVIFGHIRLFGFHWIAWYFIYFTLGAMWHRWSSANSETKTYDKMTLIISAVMFPAMAYFFRLHNEPPTFYQWINLGKLFPVAYRFIVGLIGTLFVYECFKLYNNKILMHNTLSKLGGVTLGVYYIHFIILRIIFTIPIPDYLTVVAIISYTILATIISSHLAKTCLKYKWPALLVMGKPFNR